METSSYLIIAVLALTLGHYLLASMAMAVDKAYPDEGEIRAIVTAYNNVVIQVLLGEKT